METSVITIPHQKVRLQYFLVSWKNMQYLRFGIYRGCGISWLVTIFSYIRFHVEITN